MNYPAGRPTERADGVSMYSAYYTEGAIIKEGGIKHTWFPTRKPNILRSYSSASMSCLHFYIQRDPRGSSEL
ncbi:hypothetical protein J6590_080829 [Homalodisca vitripennis]|nr:hypothetical protein J6590_080829 [Homalodisca vitripennis]